MTKTLAEIEREAIRQRLEQFHDDIPLTAKSLDVPRIKIYRFVEIERARQQTFGNVPILRQITKTP